MKCCCVDNRGVVFNMMLFILFFPIFLPRIHFLHKISHDKYDSLKPLWIRIIYSNRSVKTSVVVVKNPRLTWIEFNVQYTSV
jgi:hypothetical protein